MIETTENYIKEMITPRPRDAHKGNCGRVLLVCGSAGMAGAAVLCAKAALKSGAGLVTACVPRELFPILQTAVPEAMCIDRGSIVYDSVDLQSFDCIAAGPGLRVGREQYQIIEHLLLSYRGPLVLDADGLNNICVYGKVPEKETYMATKATEETDAMDIPRGMTSLLPEITARRKHPVILTPHPGEADRLLESLGQKKYRELGREKAAEVLAKETGAIIVLKGAGTLVAVDAKAGQDPGGDDGNQEALPTDTTDLFRNTTGNPGMATGGSGDVLTGVIAAQVAYGRALVRKALRIGAQEEGGIAAGLTPLDATRAAVYMHGLAGDLAAARIGEIGMTAMDIAEELPQAFRQIVGR